MLKNTRLDTVYIGGGTPSMLKTKGLAAIVQAARRLFQAEPREISVEINPSSGLLIDFSKLKEAGVSRISVGMQSIDDEELKRLGRIHSASDTQLLLEKIKIGGIKNISADIMIGTPGQGLESISRAIDFCLKNEVKHISAYMLKIEEGTEFYRRQNELNLPDENTESDMYLYMCQEMERRGYKQYEISNFAMPGFECRHNLKYWNCDDYLGIGPAAHSLVDGNRFYYENSFEDYYNGKTKYESAGGDPEEYAMLRLRLTDGLRNDLYKERYKVNIPKEYFERAKKLAVQGFVKICGDSICFTPKGFLLSNSVTAKILWG